ncbi:uncharacterized protein LOC110463483 [Mizuhopecten yessoensis]|uniref:uncharacterized protein LOC110463483 n=1 Tax=Mizuhopecten yessoensis TaxID=6573 RepID=UPI000B45CFAC|nr:uncharacterized protein LOC110463483 [Mizuhopecten yessoensis]
MKAYLVKQDEQGHLLTEYDSLGIGKHETLITGIYDIRVPPDRDQGMRAFEFNPGDCDDVTVRLTLKDMNPVQGHQKYTAHIKVDGEWTKTSASYQSGTIAFNASKIDTFCVSCTPFSEEFEVTPSGGCFKSKHNPAVEIQFPENSVNKTEKIDVQILPVDLSRVNDGHEPTDDARNILAISVCVEVLHSKDFTLLAPARVSLPLNVDSGTRTDKYHFVDLHWKDDGEINIEPTGRRHRDIKTTSTGYNVTFVVYKFTGRQLALVHKKATPKYIKTAARAAVGVKTNCKILVFTSASNTRTRTMRFDCVQLRRIKKAVEACEELGLAELRQCRSTEFMIGEGERIRVDISGCGRVQKEVSKEHTFIPFIGSMSDNYISIPIDIVEAFGRSVYVILNFTLISSAKIVVHGAHFDPLTAVRRPRRKRSRSPNCQAGSNGNTERTDRRYSAQECPQIAVREPTMVQTMSSGIYNTAIAGYPQAAHQVTSRATTPTSSRATSPGTQAMSISGISRQSSLEVLINSLDDAHNIGRATPKFGNAAFGDKSLLKIARKVSPNKTMELAIHLDLDHSDVDHILFKYRDNIVLANFKILMGWLGAENGSAEKSLKTLCDALGEIGHNDLKVAFQLAYEESRSM